MVATAGLEYEMKYSLKIYTKELEYNSTITIFESLLQPSKEPTTIPTAMSTSTSKETTTHQDIQESFTDEIIINTGDNSNAFQMKYAIIIVSIIALFFIILLGVFLFRDKFFRRISKISVATETESTDATQRKEESSINSMKNDKIESVNYVEGSSVVQFEPSESTLDYIIRRKQECSSYKARHRT